MKKFKKIIAMGCAAVMAMSVMCVSAFATDSNTNIKSDNVSEIGTSMMNILLSRQGEAFKNGASVNTDDIFIENDNTNLYKSYLEWYSGSNKAMGKYWTDYSYDLSLKETNGNNLVFAADLEYGRVNSRFTSEIIDYYYNISVVKINDKYFIEAIDTNEEHYTSFVRLIGETDNAKTNNTQSDLKTKVNSLITDAYEFKKQMDSIEIDATKVVDMEQSYETFITNDEASISPLSTAYSYNGERGRAYADRYHASRNPYFYEVTNGDGDCTNFVSQCIWAAYGGWTTSDSNATMQSNINAGKRMQSRTSYSNWFGGSGGGGGPWESVMNLWSFAVAGNSTGPRATGVNNGGDYNNIHPSSVLTGQVLQFRNGNSGNYRHSAYVSGGVNDSFANIKISQHSSSSSRMMLDEVIYNWGSSSCQMRQLKFNTANFNS